MPGVNLVGVGIIKNSPTPTGGPGGRPAPPPPPAPYKANVGVQVDNFNENLWRIQSTVSDLESVHLTCQSWKHTQKKQNFSEIDQNAKKHENRQNEVIFTGLAVQKISCSKISIFDF